MRVVTCVICISVPIPSGFGGTIACLSFSDASCASRLIGELTGAVPGQRMGPRKALGLPLTTGSLAIRFLVSLSNLCCFAVFLSTCTPYSHRFLALVSRSLWSLRPRAFFLSTIISGGLALPSWTGLCSQMAATLSAHRYAAAMSPPSSSSAQHHHHHSPPNSEQTNSALADEDLLSDMFAADTFSLQSNRDRDLMAMANLLQSALPQHGYQAQFPSGGSIGPASGMGQMGIGQYFAAGNSNPGNGSSWNGWRSEGYSSNSNYSSSGNHAAGSGPAVRPPPPAPSSSYVGMTSYTPATPHGTPMSSFYPDLAAGPPIDSANNANFASDHFAAISTGGPSTSKARYNTRSNARQQQQQQQPQYQDGFDSLFGAAGWQQSGTRAPACSRERASSVTRGRRPSESLDMYGGGGLDTSFEDPSEHRGRSGGQDDDMMEG